MAGDSSVIINGNGNGNGSINPLPNLRRAYQVVVAATKDMGIGKDGKLPWRLPTDLKFFKEITLTTTDHGKKNAVVMGRKTWESIPLQYRPLSGRLNVVLTRSGSSDIAAAEDVVVCGSISSALELLAASPYCTSIEKIFVIGGGEIFREALNAPECEAIHITEIHAKIECDTFMPPIDSAIFRPWYSSFPKVENNIRHSFTTYVRVRSSAAEPASQNTDSLSDNNSASKKFEVHNFSFLPKMIFERHEEYMYLRLVEEIISQGTTKGDMTGTGTLSTFGCQMRYNLRRNFPLLTTKRVFWRGVVEELLWFISGSTNAKVLLEKCIHIWDDNASREFLDSIGLSERKEGDLGPVYGFQWRHFGARYTNMHNDYANQGLDQLLDVIHKIKHNPDDRRIILSAWNPADLKLMALPPCHMFAQFYVANGELSCQMYQGSADMGLGVPYNVASYALLTCMIAHICELVPGDFIHVLGDAHVYQTHVRPLQEQLHNLPKPFPTLKINPMKKDIDSSVATDFNLIGYDPCFHQKQSISLSRFLSSTMVGDSSVIINGKGNGSINPLPNIHRAYQVVVAATKDMGIGKDGKLPWRLPTDLKFFKDITLTTSDHGKKNAVVMGRKTWESIPLQYRPLPGRLNVVLTRSGSSDIAAEENVVVCGSISSALELLAASPYNTSIEKIFVIGGGEIFREALNAPECEAIHITEIHARIECDTFMPPIDSTIFRPWYSSFPKLENNIRHSFTTYVRVRSSAAEPASQNTHNNSASKKFEVQNFSFLPKMIFKRHEEYMYLRLVEEIISQGTTKGDRTGTGTLSTFGCQMRYNLRRNFPLLTTKRVFWRGVVEELLWFISGSTNAKVLLEKCIHIWDDNASREFLDSIGLSERKEGDLGPVYGFQWRHFGARYTNMHNDYANQGLDQLLDVIHKIKHNPDDRRIILSAWNPADLKLMALPPCHMFAQFYVANGELSCQMYQGSADMGLGVPFNIASYSLLTCMIAHICELVPGDFIHVLGDAHVYQTHVRPLQEQLHNLPKPFPTLKINPMKKDIDSFVATDFKLIGYDPHQKIEMKMAV